MPNMPTKPNILLITTDTQRTDTIACMGNQHAYSPNLDKLAAEGVLFVNAHTPSAVCMPARVSLLTGVHTPIHHVIENGYTRRTDLVTFPDLLENAGYTNILVGKPHIGPIPDSFHIQRTLIGEKDAKANDIYTEHLARHGYNRAASSHPNPVPEELFCDAFIADQTMDAIEKATELGKPFFAWCSMLSPHGPLDPPGKWAHLYDNRPLPPLNYRLGEVAQHPEHLKQLLGLPDAPKGRAFYADGTPNMEFIDDQKRLYYGSAAYCDHQVGRLMRFLEEHNLRENTLVIFTSDHGTEMGDHGFHDKHNYYDESWRVPLILRLPGVLPAGTKQQFAIWNDLTATILGAAGVDAPSVQGFDLLQPLAAGGDSPRACAVGTLFKSCAVVTQRWKLEWYFTEQRGRLFSRQEDPQEQVDLWESPLYRDVRDQLLHALLAWRAELQDVEWSHQHLNGGGPVARRAVALRSALRGTDAEQRLNEATLRCDML